MLRYSIVLLMLAGLSGRASASWADELFEDRVRDFGSVPHGPMLSHPFRFTNKSEVPVHVSSVRVSCGCVAAQAMQNDIPPGHTGVILVQMNTQRFTGNKSVTVYVQFDRPHYEEVQLTVRANSRTEVMLSPDTLSFGQMRRGDTPTASINISFIGDHGFRIMDARAESNYVMPTFKEIRRDATEVVYQLSAKIRNDVPVGKWYSDIWVTTSNPLADKVRVPLTVEVTSSLAVSPIIAILDPVKLGDAVERKVLVRSGTPFRVIGVKGTDDQLTVMADDRDSKNLHVLTLRFKPTRVGEPSWLIRIHTDLPEEGEVVFQAKGQATVPVIESIGQ